VSPEVSGRIIVVSDFAEGVGHIYRDSEGIQHRAGVAVASHPRFVHAERGIRPVEKADV
jgi:hypothetical protein